jgi:hypothetical protein
MSQIPFLNELGDALDTAIARQGRSRIATRRLRVDAPRRSVVLAVLAIVVLGGGAAAAATLLTSGGQKLADGRVNCYFNTAPSPALHGEANMGSGIVSGESPIVKCRQAYRSAVHFGNAPGADPDTHGFVACQAGTTEVNVYVSDDRPRQCQRVGDRPLPATFTAATRQLQTLQTDLASIQQHRGCASPRAMAQQVRRALTSLGLDEWRISMPPSRTPANWDVGPAGTGGSCGSLAQFSWVNTPKASALLFSNHKLIYISLGPPQVTATRMYDATARLYQQTYDHCYTPESVRTLVRRAFMPLGLQVRFATNAVEKGTRYEPASERLYERGCVRFNSAYPGNDNRYVDVLLLARNAHPLHSDQFYPAARAFKP